MAQAASAGSQAMMQRDRASASLGMVVHRNEPGHSVVSMVVCDDRLDGFDVTHGGFIFALADTAFVIACNDSHHVTLAAGADTTFLKPTTSGQNLTATALLRVKSGRKPGPRRDPRAATHSPPAHRAARP
jgi:acyl-CoA thioesterase